MVVDRLTASTAPYILWKEKSPFYWISIKFCGLNYSTYLEKIFSLSAFVSCFWLIPEHKKQYTFYLLKLILKIIYLT